MLGALASVGGLGGAGAQPVGGLGGANAQPAPYAERYAALCAACHGAAGVSAQAGTPSLAGQQVFMRSPSCFCSATAGATAR